MKLSREEKKKLDNRGKDIGLYYTIADMCITEKQQDIMLELQQQIELSKVIYNELLKNAPNKPTRDHDAILQKLTDLLDHASKTGDRETYDALVNIQLHKDTAEAQQYRSYIKNNVFKKIVATPTRTKSLLVELMQYFDSYQPSEKDYKYFSDFQL